MSWLTHKYPWVKSQTPEGSNLAEDNASDLELCQECWLPACLQQMRAPECFHLSVIFCPTLPRSSLLWGWQILNWRLFQHVRFLSGYL